MRLLRAVIFALVMPATAVAQTVGTAEDNLKRKNISLPAPTAPVANYVPAVQAGSLLFLSGAGPAPSEPRGKVGKELTLSKVIKLHARHVSTCSPQRERRLGLSTRSKGS
jgi:hypothetical protein